MLNSCASLFTGSPALDNSELLESRVIFSSLLCYSLKSIGKTFVPVVMSNAFNPNAQEVEAGGELTLQEMQLGSLKWKQAALRGFRREGVNSTPGGGGHHWTLHGDS